MQRRAAAAAFVFFLLIAVGAWAYIGVAQDIHEPEVSVSGATFGNGTTATIDGVEYTVSDIAGAGGGELEATLTWTNETATQTATLAHNDTIAYSEGEYRVVVPNETDPSSFTLEQQFNVSALLADDESVENELAEQNGTSYVVSRTDRSLDPLSEWLPPRENVAVDEGDEIEYEEQMTTVEAVAADSVTLTWAAPADREAELTEGGNVTLANGEQYFAHYPSDEEVVLAHSSEYGSYAQTVAAQAYFGERMAGLWGVMIIASFAAILVLSAAYLPSRG